MRSRFAQELWDAIAEWFSSFWGDDGPVWLSSTLCRYFLYPVFYLVRRHSDMKAPPIMPATYAITWLALLILTLASTAVAFLDPGFMHLLKTFPLVRVVGSSAVVWFLLLVSLTFSDHITPDWTTK
jgi:hypothetical protein